MANFKCIKVALGFFSALLSFPIYSCLGAETPGVNKDFASLSATEHSRQVAKAFGIQTVVDRLNNTQRLAKDGSLSDDQKKCVLQDIIYLRQKFVVYMQSAILDVDSTIAYIDQETSEIMDTQAKVADRRSRMVKRENMINFVTGSLTKVTGTSLALGNFLVPNNTLDIIDGGVQGLLSAQSFESSKEDATSMDLPPPLLALVGNGKASSFRYPPAVWEFLNERIAATEMLPCQKSDRLPGVTRRERLIAKWSADGFLNRQRRSRSESACSATSRIIKTKSFSSRLLEDRSAMLTDLESVILQIKEDLGLIARKAKASYQDDPEPAPISDQR